MEIFKGQTRIPLGCGVATGKYFPDVDPREARRLTHTCKESAINYLSCRTIGLDNFLKDVGGLNLNNTFDQKGTDGANLPTFIPVFSRPMLYKKKIKSGYDFIGINFTDIFEKSLPAPSGNLVFIEQFPKINKSLLSVLKSEKVILFLSGRDIYIESFWSNNSLPKYLRIISKMGFYKIICFNFSVFFGECPLAHAYSMQRSLIIFSELQKLGVEAVPHFYWENEYQLFRIVSWLNLNKNIKLIAINCQMFKRREEFDIIAKGISYILENSMSDLHFILEGPRQELLKKICGYADKLHIASKFPAKKAEMHQQIITGKNSLGYRYDKSKDTISSFLWNVEVYEQYLRGILSTRQNEKGIKIFKREAINILKGGEKI